MKKEKKLVRIEEEQKRIQIINGANYDIQNLANATAVQLKGVYMTMELLKNELINQRIQINMINDRDRYELKVIEYIISGIKEIKVTKHQCRTIIKYIQ